MLEAAEAPILHPRVSLRGVASDLMEGGIVRKGKERRRITVEVEPLGGGLCPTRLP